jgi:hypothetical protein
VPRRQGGWLAGRHQLAAAGLTLPEWRGRWQAARLFICADGEADKA